MTSSMLFHAPYVMAELTSGSRVRPYHMLEAFRQLGYHITVVDGTIEERRKKILSLYVHKLAEYQFCYSEPSSYPVHPIWDYLFYWRLRRAGVPLGIFYRDAYWKLAPEWRRRHGFRKQLVNGRYRADWRIFQYTASAIFFPTRMLADHFPKCRRCEVLWPASQMLYDTDAPVPMLLSPPTVTYVGNVTPRYGPDILLEAINQLNSRQPVMLDLVCPRSAFLSYREVFSPYLDAPWLRLHHLAGNQLEEIYRRSDLAVVPLRRNLYNDLAMPVKLFEYFSYGLPIVVTNCTEMARFVEQAGVGLIAEDNAESLAKQIQAMLIDPALLQVLAAAVRSTVEHGHQWVDRARKVAEVLTGH